MSQTERERERYAQFPLGPGTVIYDGENHDAWIQSDFAVEVGPYG